MKKYALVSHPSATPSGAWRVSVRAALGDTLRLRYAVSGDLSRLRLPARAEAERADGLWRHTCFEAFLRCGGESDYVELNFSPSTRWAAYAFSAYREGMRPLDMAAPHITLTMAALRLEVAVDMPMPMTCAAPLRLALSAVIEDDTGGLSYWSVAHAPGKPDFHHDAGFVVTLEGTP